MQTPNTTGKPWWATYPRLKSTSPMKGAPNRGDLFGFLLGRGANPNVAGADGRTALHVAEDTRRDEIAKLLRKKGARDVDRRLYRLVRTASAEKGRKTKRTPLEITYIGNEGFLISRGEKKVLIDAIHKNPWNYPAPGERIFSMMLENRPPLDGIDLSVVSHAHADHMNARMTARLLRRNTGVTFVSSPTACDSLRIVTGADFERIAKRVVSVDPEWKEIMKLRQRGIDVEFFGVNHSGTGQTPYKTHATVIDLDGIRLVRDGIDIAFADRFIRTFSSIASSSRGGGSPSEHADAAERCVWLTARLLIRTKAASIRARISIAVRGAVSIGTGSGSTMCITCTHVS